MNNILHPNPKLDLIPINLYDFQQKELGLEHFITNQLNRTLTMFNVKGLPDTIKEKDLEFIAQVNGYGITAETPEGIKALRGTYSSPLDANDNPKGFIVNNPFIGECGFNKTFEIGKDCVLFKNDPLSIGLMPILSKYGTMLVENELTLFLSDVNLRAMMVALADSDSDKESAELFFQKLRDGELSAIICGKEDKAGILKPGESKFSLQPGTGSATQTAITQLIEYEQYIKGSFLAEIGLDANYNMKRERLTAGETDLNQDALRPLVDTMLEERQNWAKEFNAMYGYNVIYEFDSVWAKYNIGTTIPVEGDEDNEDNDAVIEEIEGNRESEVIQSDTQEDSEELSEEPEAVSDRNDDSISGEDETVEGTEPGTVEPEEMEEVDEIVEVVEDIKEIVEAITEDNEPEPEPEEEKGDEDDESNDA